MKLDDYLKLPANKATVLAAALGVKPPVISRWRGEGPIPAERCPEIEKATAGLVTCEELRPDVDWAYLRRTAGKPAELTVVSSVIAHPGEPAEMAQPCADQCPNIEFDSQGKKTCEQLRPDLFWKRVPDPNWPHPKGRPLLDLSVKVSFAAEADGRCHG